MVENYKDCLFNDKIILQLQQGFRSDNHEVYTKNVNKIALSSNDDKRLQTFDEITTYPHGTNIFKVCESKMLKVCEVKATLKILSKKKMGNVCEREREMWNAFKVCESEMWKRHAKVCESKKMLSKYKWSVLMIMRMKIKLNIIQNGHLFRIIHTEYW